MSSQSILATATPKTGIIDLSLDEASIVIDIGNYVGWGFDLNIDSLDATGTLSVFSRYTNFLITSTTSEADVVALINAGTFADGKKQLTIDSNNSITRSYLKVFWQKSGPSSGSLALVGNGFLRG